jgi:hypothetical protein
MLEVEPQRPHKLATQALLLMQRKRPGKWQRRSFCLAFQYLFQEPGQERFQVGKGVVDKIRAQAFFIGVE